MKGIKPGIDDPHDPVESIEPIDLTGTSSQIEYLAMQAVVRLLQHLRQLECEKELTPITGKRSMSPSPEEEKEVRIRLLKIYLDYIRDSPLDQSRKQGLLERVDKAIYNKDTGDVNLLPLLDEFHSLHQVRGIRSNAGASKGARCAQLVKLNAPCPESTR